MRTDSRIPDIGSRLYDSVNQRLGPFAPFGIITVSRCWKQRRCRRRRRRFCRRLFTRQLSGRLRARESLENGIRLIFRATVGHLTASAFKRTVSAGRAAPFKRLDSYRVTVLSRIVMSQNMPGILCTHTHTYTRIHTRNVGTDNVPSCKRGGREAVMINRADWSR